MESTEKISALGASYIKKGDAHEPFRSFFRSSLALSDQGRPLSDEKQFRVREFLVAREGGMNVLASPYYLEAGGTVIDWWLVRRARKRKQA